MADYIITGLLVTIIFNISIYIGTIICVSKISDIEELLEIKIKKGKDKES